MLGGNLGSLLYGDVSVMNRMHTCPFQKYIPLHCCIINCILCLHCIGYCEVVIKLADMKLLHSFNMYMCDKVVVYSDHAVSDRVDGCF